MNKYLVVAYVAFYMYTEGLQERKILLPYFQRYALHGFSFYN